MTNVANLPETESGSRPPEKLVRYCTRGAAGGGGKKIIFRPSFSPGPVAQPASSDNIPVTKARPARRNENCLGRSSKRMVVASVHRAWPQAAGTGLQLMARQAERAAGVGGAQKLAVGVVMHRMAGGAFQLAGIKRNLAGGVHIVQGNGRGQRAIVGKRNGMIARQAAVTADQVGAGDIVRAGLNDAGVGEGIIRHRAVMAAQAQF